MSLYSFKTSEKCGQNDGRTRRNILCAHSERKGALIDTLPEGDQIQTLYDFVPHVAKKYGPKRAVGYRRLVRTVTENKEINGIRKQWQLFELSPYEYMSFADLGLLIHTLGSGLRQIGLTKGDKFQIYARTSLKWFSIALGAVSQSLVITTAYDTLGEEGLTHSISQTEARGVFTEADLLHKFLGVAPHTPSLEFIVYNDADGAQPDSETVKTLENTLNLKIYSYSQIQKLGREFKHEPVKPKPEDVACIMYTSGSTGPPKGVILTHRNIVASISGINAQVGDVVRPSDYVLCFLPLAHILEFMFETVALYWGTTLGYANVKTLTNANTHNCLGDILEFRPTIMVGVPAVWEMVKKGIVNQVTNGGMIKQMAFWAAFYAKTGLKNARLPGAGIFDALIFSKVRQATGGRLRYVLSGGAPLAETTRLFITTCLCPVLIGYGLTETCATASITHPSQYTSDTIGAPLPCLDMKLIDVPDAGYSASNPKNGVEQGEICIRGASVTCGYYMDPETTKESFVDGWFRTGDIGEWAPNGHIRIIDRRKNIVKTLLGEYVALEKLESVYRSCFLVNNVCVYVDQTKRKPIAIVAPMEANLRKYAFQKNLITAQHMAMEQICALPQVINAVWHSMLEIGHVNKLKSIELIQGIVLYHEEFTVENGLVTSTQKLQRAKIVETFKSQFDRAYQMGQSQLVSSCGVAS